MLIEGEMSQPTLSMKTHNTLILLVSLTLGVGPGWAASFDCTKAGTKIEKLICADDELSRLDEELAATYADAQSPSDSTNIKSAQKTWLRIRNRCANEACIELAYRARLHVLRRIVRDADLANKPKTGTEPIEKTNPPFSLLKGKGIPVCEAYLQRLNATEWGDCEKMPTCGRPENDSVVGFAKLNRAPLTAEQITLLWGPKNDFLSQGNSERAHTTRDKPYDYKPTEDVRKSLQDESMLVWSYDPPVDIDNDGKPDDDLIIWKGELSQGVCGRRVGVMNEVSVHATHMLFVDWGGMKLNEPRTRELTEHPLGSYSLISRIKSFNYGKRVTSHRFRQIGDQLGVFAYQGQYYFDTFFDSWGDFNGWRRSDFGDGKFRIKNGLHDILGVFYRKDGITKQVCEYRWNEFERCYE